MEVIGPKSLNYVFWCIRREILCNLKKSLLCSLEIYLFSDGESLKYSRDPPR